MASQPTICDVTYDLLRELGTGRLVTDPRAAAELCIALQTARRASSADG